MALTSKRTLGLLCSVALGASLLVTGCGQKSPGASSHESGSEALSIDSLQAYQVRLERTLADPIARSELIVKIMGSTIAEDTHAFLKFHVYGFAGDGNIIPFFTMNNYIVQRWVPQERGTYSLKHYEVAYYSKFDTTEPIDNWENPLTGEVVEIPHFILGPIEREYTPEGIIAMGLAPEPLNISMIGDRIYIPTQSTDIMGNFLTPDEWGPYSNGPKVYWDSMLTFSAYVLDVFDKDKTRAEAEIHMQNMVSWAPYLKLGQTPGRTMVRAYGQHISGPDELPPDIRAGLEKYTPEIFDIDSWVDPRFDSVELMMSLQAQRENGTLDIDQDDYKPFPVRTPKDMQAIRQRDQMNDK